MTLAGWIGGLFAGLALIGIVYQLIAFHALQRFFAKAPSASAEAPPVTLLKPLHGAEPRLAQNLATFLDQDYAGAVQMVCGVNLPQDLAAISVDELIKRRLDADIVLSDGPRQPAGNAKVANLAAMMPATRHDVLILSDSDIAVRPDYLSAVTAALAQPGVGAVSCLYTGRGDAGVWSKIGAAILSYAMMPRIVMSLTLGAARPCMGSTIALRRETLDEIGGFERFTETLADDYAIGQAVAAQGLAVAVPPMLVTHAGAEESLGSLWRQHLRWAVTIRGVAPMRHIGSGVVHALPLALLTMPFLPLPGLPLALAALALRLGTAVRVDRLVGRKSAPYWLLPIADMVDFSVYIASLLTTTIDWRGRRLTMARRGRIAQASLSTPEIR